MLNNNNEYVYICFFFEMTRWHVMHKQPNTENAITVTDIKELMFILLKVIIIFHKGLKSLAIKSWLRFNTVKNFAFEYETKKYLNNVFVTLKMKN